MVLTSSVSRIRRTRKWCVPGRLDWLCGVYYLDVLKTDNSHTTNFIKAFDKSTQEFYQSDEFKQRASESASFLEQLPQFLDGRPVTLENMVGCCSLSKRNKTSHCLFLIVECKRALYGSRAWSFNRHLNRYLISWTLKIFTISVSIKVFRLPF